MTNICVNCSTEFEGHHNRKYCDKVECQLVKKEKINSTKNKKHQKNCLVCNQTFMGYSTRKYCENCTEIAISDTENTCIVCETSFKGHFNQHYCNSDACQTEKRERKRIATREYDARPERKVKRLAIDRSEEGKARRQEYNKRPEVREHQNAWSRKYHPKWNKENPEKVKAYQKKFSATEKGRLMRERARRKKLSTPKGRIMNRVRSNIHIHLKKRRLSKGGKTFELLGYSGEELTSHIESQFKDGMSWDNMDEWHIDHIRPVASFDFDSMDDPEFKKCWALSNLQPLWALENMQKGSKWNGED